MRVNKRTLCAVIIVVVAGFSLGADTAGAASPRILIARAGEASTKKQVKNGWFSALTEHYYHLRFDPVRECGVIPLDSVNDALRLGTDYGRTIRENDLFDAALRLKATHVLAHTYYIDKEVNYYLEVIDPKDRTVIMVLDENFSLDRIGEQLDKCALAILEKLGVTLSDLEQKVLKRPILGNNPKTMKQLGETLQAEGGSRGKNTPGIAKKYLDAANRDGSLVLAWFKAARAHDAIGDHARAADLFYYIIVNTAVGYPRLYVQASRNFRLVESTDRAQQILAIADELGWKSPELTLEKAVLYEKTGNREQARTLYEEISAQDPDQPDALLFFARRAYADESYEEALSFAQRLIERNAYPGDAHVEKGRCLIALKRNQEAFKALLTAGELQPDNSAVHAHLGDLYSEKNEFLKAADHFERALKGMSNNLDVLLKTSDSYRAAGDLKKALSVLSAHASQFYTTKDVTKEMGLIEWELKDTASARRRLETCIAIEPPDARVFLAMGDIYTASGEYTDAIAMFKRAESLVDDKNQLMVARASLYLLTNQAETAVRDLREVLARVPDYPRANRFMGDALRMKGNTKDALEYYLKERRYHGDDAFLQYHIAQIYFQLGNETAAENESRKLVKLDPTSPAGYFQLAVILLKQKKVADAQSFISQGEVVGKAGEGMYRELGNAFAAAGSLDKAIDSYRKAIKQNSGDEDSWKGLAEVYFRARKDTAAAEACLKIFDMNPAKNAPFLARAGHTFYSLGLKSRATAAYSQFLEKGNTDDLVNVNMAFMAFELNDYAGAIARLKGVGVPHASKPDIIRMRMVAHSELGEYPAAFSHAQTFLKSHPRDSRALEIAARASEETGDLKSASILYARYLELKTTPAHKDYAYHLARLYEKRGLSREAIGQYQKNVIRYPDDFRNHERLAHLYLKANRLTDALQLLSRATRNPNAPPGLHKELAEIYRTQGKAELAAVSYENYLAKSAGAADSTDWYILASIYYARKEYGKAIAPLRKATGYMPSNARYLYELGYALCQSDSLAAAVAPLQRAHAIDNKNPEPLNLLVRCYETLKDTANLIAVYEKRAALSPRDYQIIVTLGRLYLAAGKIEFAADALEKAVTLKPSDLASHMSLAHLYEKRQNEKKWLEHLDAALRSSPRNADIHFENARYHIATNDIDQAKTSLKRAIEFNPKHVGARALYGGILRGAGEYAAAYTQFSEAVRWEPKNIEYLHNMALTALQSGKNDVAIKVIDKALSIEPSNTQLTQSAGRINFMAGKKTRAEKLLLKALDADKGCSMCHEYLGYLYYGRGEYDNAIRHLDNAVKRDSRNDSAMVKLADALVRKEKLKESLALYEKAFIINPRNDEVLYSLCAVNLDLGNVGAAETILNNNKRVKSSGWIHLIQARVLEAKGDYATAAVSYTAAQRSLTGNFDADAGLARVYLQLRKYNDAVRLFGKAIAGRPDDPALYTGIAKAYYGLMNYNAAIEYLSDALKKEPGNADARYIMALALSKKGKHEKALEELKRAAKDDSRNAEIHFALGMQYQVLKMFNDAIESYNRAVRYDKNKAAEAYLHIGNIYYVNLKDNRNAKKNYEKHIEAGGTNAKVKDTLKKL